MSRNRSGSSPGAVRCPMLQGRSFGTKLPSIFFHCQIFTLIGQHIENILKYKTDSMSGNRFQEVSPVMGKRLLCQEIVPVKEVRLNKKSLVPKLRPWSGGRLRNISGTSQEHLRNIQDVLNL